MPATEPVMPLAEYIDGEGDLDPIIAARVAREHAGEEPLDLPQAFIEKVHTALEYAMAHQRLDEHECCRRRHRTNEWIDELRWGNRYRDWCESANEKAARLLRQMTPEEQEAEKQRRANEKELKKQADARAELLLRSSLSRKQLGELKRRGYFHVMVGKRRFRITRKRTHNVMEVDARGRVRKTFCAHPIDQVPDADTMLAQKLWLETEPKEFFKIANVMRRDFPRSTRAETARDNALGRARSAEAVENLRVAQELRRQMHEATQEAIRGALDASSLTQQILPPQQIVPEQVPVPVNDERAA